VEPQPRQRRVAGRRQDFRAPEGIAHRAQALEIGLPGEIERARRGRLGRRLQDGAQAHDLSRPGRISGAQTDARANRRRGGRQSGNREVAQGQAVAPYARLDDLDQPGHGERPEAGFKDRRGNLQRPQLGAPEPSGDHGAGDEEEQNPAPTA